MLAPNNDPFYVVPSRVAAAEWFEDLWRRLRIPIGWHYRRIHYVFVSQEKAIVMLDGTRYKNTLECWSELCKAARDAVTLELVPDDAYSDHRNGAPIVYLVEPQNPNVEIDYGWSVCSIPVFPPLPELTFDRPIVPQPYHIEIWAEKTTVNDILGLNLITGIGEISAIHCRGLVDRIEKSHRPVRLLYVSDFDPGGMSMPIAAARKIEFEIRKRGVTPDVQLQPIVLTHEQCVEHRLPRTPIKETERRAKRFEERFGEGGTELDALEALHPGLLRQIVLDEVGRYWNRDHDDDVDAACESIERRFRAITTQAHDKHRDQIDALRAEWQQILANINSWRELVNPVWQAISDELDQNSPLIDDTDWCPEFIADEDPDPLFDSTRSYLEQIDRYKRHQGKPTAQKPIRRDGHDEGGA